MAIKTTPQTAKKVMDASIPKNISAPDLARIQAEWAAKAQERAEMIEKGNRTPQAPNKAVKAKLERFGHLWQAYLLNGKQWRPLLPSPSLLSSALDLLQDALVDEANS